MSRIIAWIVAVLALLVAGAFGYGYISNAKENARLVSELETIIATQKAKIEKHDVEIERRDLEYVNDHAYYATLKNEVKKFKRLANVNEQKYLSTLPELTETVETMPRPCHENPDPVIPADLVRMHNDATSRLP
ncbi:MAG: hypothetical protein LBI35_01200 [Burkholderiales bacterium]|jgi:uncharacterized protein YxeA|nr:hypothetical protein [Burkholderiales bacterium]